jgi:phosphoglycerol transferase MdoB-like AlkP superfamily enzyme
VSGTTFSIAATLLAVLILSGFRLGLYFYRRSELESLTLGERLRVFWVGFRLDSVIVSRSLILPVLLTLLLPDSILAGIRPFLLAYLGMVLFIFFLAETSGLYFFSYYGTRLNYLVFEHGTDREVIKTIRKGYPVGRIVVLSALASTGSMLIVSEIESFDFIGGLTELSEYWDRIGNFIWLSLFAFATRGTFDHRPLNPSLAWVTTNRIANEIANCGIFNLLYDWVHRFKSEFTPLKSIIKLPAAEEAVLMARRYLSTQGCLTDDSPNPLVRRVSGKLRAEPLNVVLVVMESFTARLVGCLGGCPALSPEFDRLTTQGVLLEKCYATGERTIQALEAAVSSFPPLPGAGVVMRPQARQGFATLARVLKEREYATLFLYGGQGIFDHMRVFFVANGFDSFIEEKDFVNPVFRSPWGVSDEDLFDRADQEFRRLHNQGRPFFASILTVSLHSPWKYPAGRIKPLPTDTPVPPGFELEELNNFLYADYAIGKFMRAAHDAPYFGKTLFVFVGDHGVHLRGRDLVPVDEYRVPALFLAPAHLQPLRITGVTSQIDLPTTIMGILGGEYRNPFFGQDVLKRQPNDSFAVVIYNKKRYGIVADRELTVLAETGETFNYERSGSNEPWRQIAPATPSSRSAIAVALLRVAEDLIVGGRFTASRTPSA